MVYKVEDFRDEKPGAVDVRLLLMSPPGSSDSCLKSVK
jgi:hypothetical protein